MEFDSKYLELMKIKQPAHYDMLFNSLSKIAEMEEQIREIRKNINNIKRDSAKQVCRGLAKYYREYLNDTYSAGLLIELSKTGKCSKHLSMNQFNNWGSIIPLTGVYHTDEDTLKYGAHWYEDIKLGEWK